MVTMNRTRLLVFISLTILLVGQPSSFAQSEGITINSLHIDAEVVDNYAVVNQTYSLTNADTTDQMLVLDLPSLSYLMLSNITILGDNLTLYGRVFPTPQAQEIFDDTVEQNLTGALLVQTYSGYELRVNVPADSSITMAVYYEGLLRRVFGIYSFDVFANPNVYDALDFSLDLTILSNLSPVIGYDLPQLTGYSVTTLANGLRLTYEKSSYVPSTIGVEYSLADYSDSASIIAYDGEEDFFAYFLAPRIEETVVASKQVVFVIDSSGSMSGNKIEQTKQALIAIIDSLGGDDFFTIIDFDSNYQMLWDDVRVASENNKNDAKQWVNGLEAGGGTSMLAPMLRALEEYSNPNMQNLLFLLSDGLPSEDSNTILTQVSENNNDAVIISTIALGEDADENLMSSIASQNGGVYIKIQDDPDAADEILTFFSTFTVAAISEWSVSINGGTQVNFAEDLTNSPFGNGTELIITGKFSELVNVETYLGYEDGGVTSDLSVAINDAGDLPHLEKLWAQQRIRLLDQFPQLSDSVYDNASQEILELALAYGLVVPGVTSMVLSELVEGENYQEDETATLAQTAADAFGRGAAGGGGVFSDVQQAPLSLWVILLALIPVIRLSKITSKKSTK